MVRWLRRMVLLGAMVTLVAVLVRRQSAQRTPPYGIDPADAQWPPFETVPEPVAATVSGSAPDTDVEPEAALAAVTPAPSVDPVDGACPTTHPVKANSSSGIYHVPGGRFYDRTKPERCYSTPDAAAADGYRPAKA